MAQSSLRGKMQLTSGRVSTEMVAKAARLDFGLIASHPAPSDRAIELSEQAGITLIDYLRGRNLEIYSHHEQLPSVDSEERIPGVSGVILAGGESRRMGSNKSLLPLQGARFIDHVYARLSGLFNEVIVVTNSPEIYRELPCRKVPDIYHSQGALAGVHSGLVHSRTDKIFVAACDMPFIKADVVRAICAQADRGDVVIPYSPTGHEPLHALYSKSCLPAMEQVLDAGQQRIMSFFHQVRLAEIPAEELTALDPLGESFQNINTPEEYFSLHRARSSHVDLGECQQQR